MAASMGTKVAIGAVALSVAFLFGYVPAGMKLRTERAERVRLTRALAVADLQIQLGMMSHEANRDNYGLAAQLATGFFDRVRSEIARPGDGSATTSLQSILARRDEITADLAQANSGVKLKIAELYAHLYRLSQPPLTARAVVSL